MYHIREKVKKGFLYYVNRLMDVAELQLVLIKIYGNCFWGEEKCPLERSCDPLKDIQNMCFFLVH